MSLPRTSTRALLLTLALLGPATRIPAQSPATSPPKDATPIAAKPRPRTLRPKPVTPASPTYNTGLILLDPAHGGADPGGRLGPNLLEKDLTLAFAHRLQALLAGRGFTVVLTREADPTPQPQPVAADPGSPAQPMQPPPPPPQVTPDQRAELANRLHPVACILIHATASGRGVHLFNSSLAPPPASDEPRPILLWDTAQAPILTQSLALTADLAQSLNGSRIPLVTGRASVRPIDSMTCPAVSLELAPDAATGGAPPPSPTLPTSSASPEPSRPQWSFGAATPNPSSRLKPQKPTPPPQPTPMRPDPPLPRNPDPNLAQPSRTTPPEPPDDSSLPAHPLLDAHRRNPPHGPADAARLRPNSPAHRRDA